jgi:hypothetical protein
MALPPADCNLLAELQRLANTCVSLDSELQLREAAVDLAHAVDVAGQECSIASMKALNLAFSKAIRAWQGKPV